MSDISNKKMVLSRDTLMPLGLVLTVCGGLLWINTKLVNIQFKLETLEGKLEDQWTRRDMENWGLKLKMSNPEIKIPGMEQ
jgi:hypothetical protein